LAAVAKKRTLKYDVFYDVKLGRFDKKSMCPDMQLDVVVQTCYSGDDIPVAVFKPMRHTQPRTPQSLPTR